ncbi:hypothetical protein [Teichococcus vastitatis]|uniref:Uncharacterized protein n=1 Tax=Teichococcus vastitatis TaxID=2307076 RepID=A0ABS9WBB6_9PROT|nr:hypothetical protein [Pseudoroseomonas vastitatis]MCI0756590.1 hypothetical protein [Pseudoroseomonas vastitatis]
MRRWLMLGVGAAFLGTAGLAAAQPAPPAPPGAEVARPAPSGPAPGGPDGAPHRGPGGRDGMRGPHGMMHGRHHAPPGASFAFRRGDTMVRIQCSDREPVQACVEAANALFDKFNAAPR